MTRRIWQIHWPTATGRVARTWRVSKSKEKPNTHPRVSAQLMQELSLGWLLLALTPTVSRSSRRTSPASLHHLPLPLPFPAPFPFPPPHTTTTTTTLPSPPIFRKKIKKKSSIRLHLDNPHAQRPRRYSLPCLSYRTALPPRTF